MVVAVLKLAKNYYKKVLNELYPRRVIQINGKALFQD